MSDRLPLRAPVLLLAPPGEQQYVGPHLKAFPHTHTVLSQDDRAAKQKIAVFFANKAEMAKQEGLWD